MPKSAVPRHRRNRDGIAVTPVQMRMPDSLHERVKSAANTTKRTVPALITLFIEQGLERMTADGSGAVSQ